MHKVARAIKRLFAPKFAPFQHPKIHKKSHIAITWQLPLFISKTRFLSQKRRNKTPFWSKITLMRFSKSVVFSPPFLQSSTLQIYAVLRLFRLSFLYILFLTFIKGFLIKVNSFRVLCGIKSIEYIKNDRALCAPSSIFLQLTIWFRPVVFLLFYAYIGIFFFVLS